MAEVIVFTSLIDVYAAIKSHEVENSVQFARRDVTKLFGSDGEYVIIFVWPSHSVTPVVREGVYALERKLP